MCQVPPEDQCVGEGYWDEGWGVGEVWELMGLSDVLGEIVLTKEEQSPPEF